MINHAPTGIELSGPGPLPNTRRRALSSAPSAPSIPIRATRFAYTLETRRPFRDRRQPAGGEERLQARFRTGNFAQVTRAGDGSVGCDLRQGLHDRRERRESAKSPPAAPTTTSSRAAPGRTNSAAGSGDDILWGGLGKDMLTGNAGQGHLRVRHQARTRGPISTRSPTSTSRTIRSGSTTRSSRSSAKKDPSWRPPS